MDADSVHRLQWLLERRRSSRARFDPGWHVSPAELALIVDASRWAPTAHNMQNFHLVAVDEPGVLAQLGQIQAPVTRTFVVESYRPLASSPEELAVRKAGILGTRFPASWRTDDPDRIPADLSRSLAETIDGAPLVIVVVYDPSKRAPASEGDVLGMISLGCVLANMWLAANAAHLDVQVISAFAGIAESEVKRVLAVPSTWRVAFAMRVGHTSLADDDPRVRRDVETFVHRNRFR